MSKKQFDVFLSHSSVDKPWVIKLKDDLLRYGVSVWLDKDEIRPGDLFVDALEQGLDNSMTVAFIISPEDIASGWVKEEYLRALGFALDRQNSLQLIPVIIREAKLPGFLQNRNWVDFRDEPLYTQNVWKLVWGITNQKPTQILDLNTPDSSYTTPIPDTTIPIKTPISDTISAISELALGQKSLTSKLYKQIKDLSQNPSSELRQELLKAIQKDYTKLPQELRQLIGEFATDKAIIIRANIAGWIIENFNQVGWEYKPILKKLAQDESFTVQQRIVDVGSFHIGRSPSDMRKLVLELIDALSRDIKIKTLKGSGMLVGESNDLILEVTNQNKMGTKSVELKITLSAEYTVLGSNSISIPTLKAGEAKKVTFQLKMKVAKQVVVNYYVNGVLKEPPLYINAVEDNPYIYGNPIEAETAFFGRQKILERIVQAVTKPTKQDILIVGERRTGKTSLIYQLQKRLEHPFIPVYVVLNTIEPNPDSVLQIILRKITQSLIKSGVLEQKWLDHAYPYLDFVDNLQDMIEAAKANLVDMRVILLLDEADFLLKVDERLQNILRAALQSREVGVDLRAVMAGTSDLSTYISQRSSPFFNHFRFEPLKPLTQQETEALIVKPAAALEYTYMPSAINRLIDLSGRQLYYCQALCYEAFDYAVQAKRNNISDEDVAAAEKKIIEDLFNSYLSGFWERTNKAEQRFLMALAADKTLPAITKAQLNRLLGWQLVTEVDGSYQIASGLIKKWTMMTS